LPTYVQKDLLVSGSEIFFKEKFSTDRTTARSESIKLKSLICISGSAVEAPSPYWVAGMLTAVLVKLCRTVGIDSATDDSVGQDNLWSISAGRVPRRRWRYVHKPAVTAGHVDLATDERWL